MIWVTESKTYDFEDLGYIAKSMTRVDIPTIRNSKQPVIGKDGQYTFTDGLDNKIIAMKLTAIDDNNITIRRFNIREIKKALLTQGKLIFKLENDIYWNAKVLQGSTIQFNATYDEIIINFDLEPVAHSLFDKTKTSWEDIDISWELINRPWEALGEGYEFDLIAACDITVTNYGNYKALPIIKITANNSITLTKVTKSFTISTAGTYYIDNDNRIVYDDSNVNQMSKFSGDFFSLDTEDNIISVSGPFTTATVEFIDKDAYV